MKRLWEENDPRARMVTVAQISRFRFAETPLFYEAAKPSTPSKLTSRQVGTTNRLHKDGGRGCLPAEEPGINILDV